MGWGRKSHFFATVRSKRQREDRICSDRLHGFTITAAGWRGAIKVRVGGDPIADRFVVELIPWLKSDTQGEPVRLAEGVLDYDDRLKLCRVKEAE